MTIEPRGRLAGTVARSDQTLHHTLPIGRGSRVDDGVNNIIQLFRHELILSSIVEKLARWRKPKPLRRRSSPFNAVAPGSEVFADCLMTYFEVIVTR
jgi:hypothetical protein